jgi:hypothetical protein
MDNKLGIGVKKKKLKLSKAEASRLALLKNPKGSLTIIYFNLII